MELVRVGDLVAGQEFVTPITRKLGRVIEHGRGEDGGVLVALIPPGSIRFDSGQMLRSLHPDIMVEHATLVFRDDVVPENLDGVVLVAPSE